MLSNKKKRASDEDDSSPKLRYETPRSSKSRSLFNHDCLLEFPFLAGRDPRFLDLLTSELNVRLFQAGDTIMEEGDVGDSMYFLVMGKVAIWKEPGPAKLCELWHGNVFGEMALLEGRAAKRTATVKAVEFCDCRVIHQRVFNKILKQFPKEKEFYHKMAAERAAANTVNQAKAEKAARDKRRRAASVLGALKGQLGAKGKDQDAEDADPKPSRMRSLFAGVSTQPSAAAASRGRRLSSSMTKQLLDLTAKMRLRKSLFSQSVVLEVAPILGVEEGCEELSRQESQSQADTEECDSAKSDSSESQHDENSPMTGAVWKEAASILLLGATSTTTTTATTATRAATPTTAKTRPPAITTAAIATAATHGSATSTATHGAAAKDPDSPLSPLSPLTTRSLPASRERAFQVKRRSLPPMPVPVPLQLRRPVGSQREGGQAIYRIIATQQAGQFSCEQSHSPPATPTSPLAMREFIRHNHNNNTTQAPVVPPPVWRASLPSARDRIVSDGNDNQNINDNNSNNNNNDISDPRNDPWKVANAFVPASSAGSPTNSQWNVSRSGKQRDDAGKVCARVAPWNKDVHKTAPRPSVSRLESALALDRIVGG